VATQNKTIRRNVAICEGDSNGNNSFDPSAEWESFSKNSFDGLGHHNSTCSQPNTDTGDTTDGGTTDGGTTDGGTTDGGTTDGGTTDGGTTDGGTTDNGSLVQDLFFSEYIEGSYRNRALEIYNGTGADITFTGNYSIEMYKNGSSSPSYTLSLDGATLSNGGVYVIGNRDADNEILDVSDVVSSVTWFTGDDTIVLLKNGQIIDTIGEIGYDPGYSWTQNGVSTKNQTIRRNAAVCAGDSNSSDSFDPSAEWESYSKNSFDGLGKHTSNCQ